MIKIKQFETNFGVLFSFEKDRYTPVYLSSDLNTLSEDILSQETLEGEIYEGGKFTWEKKKYEITKIHGWRYSSLVPDVPHLQVGKVNKYSFIMKIIVKQTAPL